ncbi:hypothetical protein [Nocardioides sp. zg-DK7169]|uniref:hypothetical protein n=1 Tax=Nocardioides sp. zg-DK7169 TaxID=2736600 RepID=UPI0015540A24|nr:hypothetical protein [Nocardioides sp. zg-DK7169]NPC95655.1 hypothetical protein [Nocardioides sp. zg-DK7169]
MSTGARAAAALLAGLLFLAGLPTAPSAGAATCTDGRGVSVVVDFGALGGGVQDTCDADGGGKSAATIFADSGVALTYAQRAAGFVCRVEGVPSSDPCINAAPADAYWGLWWSDGRTGTWVYSSIGTSSLTVPAGGSVAFAWNSGARTQPGVAPPVAAAPAAPSSPRPTPSTGGGPGGSAPTPVTGSGDGSAPGSAPGTGAGAGSAAGGDAPTAAPTPTAGDRPTGGPTREPKDRDTATASPSASVSPSAEQEDTGIEGTQESAATTDDAGLPGWLVAVVLAAVFAGAGLVAVRRRGTVRR